MKTALTIVLLLSSMVGWGQEPVAELDEWWHYPGNDSLYTYNYFYNNGNGDSLSSINKYDFWKNGSFRWGYKDDKCIKITGEKDDGDYYYEYLEYFDDSVIRTKNYKRKVYYINDNHCVYKAYKMSSSGDTITYEYAWYNGNMVELYKDSVLQYNCSYYTEYINPWYAENRFLRSNSIRGFMSGSYNLLKSINYPSGYKKTFEVVDHDGPFPTKVREHRGGRSTDFYHFYYRSMIVNTPELASDPTEIFSIDYYDVMGRKIQKPKRGFYVEIKITEKGVIRNKYYIQQ